MRSSSHLLKKGDKLAHEVPEDPPREGVEGGGERHTAHQEDDVSGGQVCCTLRVHKEYLYGGFGCQIMLHASFPKKCVFTVSVTAVTVKQYFLNVKPPGGYRPWYTSASAYMTLFHAEIHIMYAAMWCECKNASMHTHRLTRTHARTHTHTHIKINMKG